MSITEHHHLVEAELTKLRPISDLINDPYRSLAGMLRTAGGYAKDTSAYAEFLWADYLRPHISRAQIRKSMDVAVREALGLARSLLARYLPGWSGATPAVVLTRGKSGRRV